MAAKSRDRRSRVVRNASSRPRWFYPGLIAIAVVGASILAYLVARKPVEPEFRPIAVDASSVGPGQGYVMGNPDAPVKILEFADFECPSCARFATITEPDVRRLIIEPGLASLTFFDFPLPQHSNSQPASHAAACAHDQGRFWDMHDRIFAGQDEWNTQATSSPKSVFAGYARAIGLNMQEWESCYDSRRNQGRIEANFAEGERRQVNSTPTFVIGNRLYPGSLSYDQLKSIVDSAAASAAVAPAPAGPAAPAATP